VKRAFPGNSFRIGEHRIGSGSPAFVIAEIGINHNGELKLALDLIDAAVECRVDAVKFQTFRTQDLVSANSEYYEAIAKNELRPEDFERIADHAGRRGIIFISTPFDEKSADLLEELGVPAFKIASGDITHLPLIRHLARKNKPLLISTGASTIGEVEDAVSTAKRENTELSIALLHCVSHYPAEPHELNLRVLDTLRNQFEVPIGFSDHTLGIISSPIAVALGADLVEKHFTLDKNLEGPDHKLSCNPQEMKLMVEYIRVAEDTLGIPSKKPVETEETRKAIRRSLTASEAMTKGTEITREKISFRRPATGLPPRFIDTLIGRKTRRGVEQESTIVWDDI
jgi:N-acetylneuraminate synthase/N,N'-diacetyllegionaminate synthase